jgi:hypothetical protein
MYNTSLLNLLRDAGIFKKIWAAYGKHEIQYAT